MVIGALIYKAFCRGIETRTMVFVAMIITSIGIMLQFIFAKRWNLDIGVSDLLFLFFTDVIFSVLSTLFFSIPIFSFFAKITPSKVEATVYAFLTGTTDLSLTVISPLWGSFIN